MKHIKTYESFGKTVKSMFSDAFGKKKEVKQKTAWAPASPSQKYRDEVKNCAEELQKHSEGLGDISKNLKELIEEASAQQKNHMKIMGAYNSVKSEIGKHEKELKGNAELSEAWKKLSTSISNGFKHI